MSDVTPASDIIREAEAVSALTIDELMTSGDDNEMTAALNVLVNNGDADEQVGEVGAPIGHVARVDRFLLYTDNYGFREWDEYETEDLAKVAFSKIESDYEKL